MPQRFGRYVLLDRMGHRGMAEVFRAVVPGAEGFRRELVLKRILAERASSPKFIEMFVHEARISALLHHPNIVQVFDFGQVDGSYFLAMEMLRGKDLHATMRALRENGQKFPIPIAVHIAHQIASGLSYAHKLKAEEQVINIVHRDVSPSNIMCLRAGGVKLLDFGVASALGETGSNDPDSRAFRGKLSYAAPEYVLGHGQDARIDLFALGVILWEMVVGKRLFQGQSDEEKLHSLLELPVPPPSTRRPAVSEELDRIVMRALERDPARRYQTAAAMVEDLEQVALDVKYQPHMLPHLLDGLFGTEVAPPPIASEVEKLIQSGSIQPVVTVTNAAFTSARTYTASVAVVATLAVLAGAGLAALLPRASSNSRSSQAHSTSFEVLPLGMRSGAPATSRKPDDNRTLDDRPDLQTDFGQLEERAPTMPPSAVVSAAMGASPPPSQPARRAPFPATSIAKESPAPATMTHAPSLPSVTAATSARAPRKMRGSGGRLTAVGVGSVLKGKSIDPFAEAASRPGRK
jgi:serine/threonine protein kinase